MIDLDMVGYENETSVAGVFISHAYISARNVRFTGAAADGDTQEESRCNARKRLALELRDNSNKLVEQTGETIKMLTLALADIEARCFGSHYVAGDVGDTISLQLRSINLQVIKVEAKKLADAVNLWLDCELLAKEIEY